MKLITAIIQEDKLDEVREALIAAEIGRITVTRVDGHGQQEGTEIYRGHVVVPNLIPKVEIKIGVNEEFVDMTVDTILQAARHGANGKIGDGKIFITPLEECIRIRTGQRGGDAI
jgi:nitrogen regulatory protein P-II 1